MGGKNFRGGKGRGGGRRGGRNDGAAHRPYQRFAEIQKEHAQMQTYYDTLLEFSEEEKEEFWGALKRDLPNSFRFCGSKGHALTVKRLFQRRYIPEITSLTFEEQPVEPPQAVPWYPDSLAWWMTTPKNVIRKFPPFSAFQKFLVSETSVGNISRQEVVSMIPPLLMDLRPGMTVLDMCAAPGSKAAQLLEMVHRGEEVSIRKVMRAMQESDLPDGENADENTKIQADLVSYADSCDDGRATGILIANDSDYKRSHLLVHQLKRLSSPNMIVTNHDATLYPAIRVRNRPDETKPAYLKFDRILADVPCSGDGAFFIAVLRKNAEFKAKPDEAKVQTPNGNATNGGKNGLKRPLAEEDEEARPAKVVKAEGDISEDSVVVEARDAAEMDVDEGAALTTQTTPDATKAKDNQVEMPAPLKDAESAKTEDTTVDMAPGHEIGIVASNDMNDVQVGVNHRPDTMTPGSEDSRAPTPASEAQFNLADRKRKKNGPYEEPFKFLKPDHDVIRQVKEFYGISARFPTDRYLVRNEAGEPAKAVYYTSALVREVLTMNEGRGVKFVHAGVKMFVKQDVPSADTCRWRIQSEGMPILHGYVGANRVVVLRNKETLRRLLIEMFPKITDGDWQQLGEVGEQVRNMGLGCCVLRVEPAGDDEDFAEEMAMPLWKSFQSVNLMLPKEDRAAMLLRIFNDSTPLVNTGLAKNQSQGGEAEVTESVAEAAESVAEATESAKDEETAEPTETQPVQSEGVVEAKDREMPDVK
ncbi:hypothetical protein P8C59_001440 [Phyllachora maydis]|uniref:SAM-dependent MTase RsmB/NOP-type domain-containing protein n=1 Tax=Phyllachora maydis TaxID=1825666 RepID=A0AAD9M942_9PEZI|nr:hypothetical protein P8C59_001440 [Phyllachora maydis]